MKKALLFFGGFISGIIATFLVLFIISASIETNNNELSGLTMFSEKGECIARNGEIKVFQVLRPHIALATIGDIISGTTVLLINHDEKHYYDEQKIKIPRGKCARHIGIFQYTTKSNDDKIVPVVVIE